MNKLLYYVRVLLFIIVMIPFIIYPHYVLSTNIYLTLSFFLFSIILFIMFIAQQIKKKDYIKYNNLYNFSCIISFIYMIIVLLRGLFDSFIIYKSMNILAENAKFNNINTFFISNNMIYFVILLFGLLIYNILLIESKK
jgi:hypothetical protein